MQFRSRNQGSYWNHSREIIRENAGGIPWINPRNEVSQEPFTISVKMLRESIFLTIIIDFIDRISY